MSRNQHPPSSSPCALSCAQVDSVSSPDYHPVILHFNMMPSPAPAASDDKVGCWKKGHPGVLKFRNAVV